MRAFVEINERTRRDEVLATALAVGEQEGNIGDLLGQDVDGAVDPDYLLIGVVHDRGRRGDVVTGEPGEGFGGKSGDRSFSGRGRATGERDVEAENVHRIFDF